MTGATATRKPTAIVALDMSAAAAMQLVDDIGDLCDFYKVGSELFTAEGVGLVRSLRDRGARVFLDLKFHDIPNTVRGAARGAAELGASLITVHASGGRAMIEAAVAGASEASADCGVLAVTILTSLDETILGEAWGRPVASVDLEVLRLARVARDAGATGVVCSGREARLVKHEIGDSAAIVVPGIRPAGADRQDQARTVTPREAATAGATHIVLGRAVTRSKSPRDALSAVLADLP